MVRGIGAVIGSGIFTVIGTAISGEQFDTSSILNTPLADYIVHHTAMAGRPGAGPAIALSLVLVSIVCALTGLCYAELASMIPIAGSAYTYTYGVLGELVAWIVGWALGLEYGIGAAVVCVGWSGYMNGLLTANGWGLPQALQTGLFAGGPIRGGRVVGASDPAGHAPIDRPVTPAEIAATIYHGLGIPLDTPLPGPNDGPIPVVDPGVGPIGELF